MKKQDDMRTRLNNSKLSFYIGDVRTTTTLENQCRCRLCFSCCCFKKELPSCEFFPLEAAKTNIFGTQNVIDAASVNNVDKVICLSTDKAAHPIKLEGFQKL